MSAQNNQPNIKVCIFYYSNGIGPLISIWVVATTGSVTGETLTPLWILAYGGIGISIGFAIWGRRVVETMGENLTKITPSR